MRKRRAWGFFYTCSVAVTALCLSCALLNVILVIRSTDQRDESPFIHRGRPDLSLKFQQAPISSFYERPGCDDLQDKCQQWYNDGECRSNPGYVLRQCPQSCGMCKRHYLQDPPREVHLSGGASMPMLGFGTASTTSQAVTWALEAGYRLIDSAQAREWYNEVQTAKALLDSPISRDQVFLTSKLHPRHHGYTSTLRELNQTLSTFKTDRLDLLLLHYRECWPALCGDARPEGTWKQSWRAAESAVRSGRLGAIGASAAPSTARCAGVSNFNVGQLQELQDYAEIKPAVVQVNIDVFNQNTLVQHWCRNTGIRCQAYSSLGTQWKMKHPDVPNPVLTSPVVANIAAEVERSPSQVVLRWALQSNQAVIPQSSNRDHIVANFQLYDFTLNEEMMRQLDGLDGTHS